MTILPTKKSSQSKSEADGSDPSSFHGDRHGHSGHSAEQYNFANRNSPPRWAAPNASSRDEKRPAHATASGFDEFDAVDSGPSHSKRRHRASPHRSLRKGHHRASGVSNFAAKPSTSQGANSPAVEDAASARDDADPSGYNSGDEYDKPPELWTTEEFKEASALGALSSFASPRSTGVTGRRASRADGSKAMLDPARELGQYEVSM
ncbi:hypothetical protein V5799_007994 [Amblyomma americanum]|uniref:Uncharacterized protein n=1 Tax=Amblyomma americanum TaxID=6943 RepID=A0AAQ4FEM2_AMBAM